MFRKAEIKIVLHLYIFYCDQCNSDWFIHTSRPIDGSIYGACQVEEEEESTRMKTRTRITAVTMLQRNCLGTSYSAHNVLLRVYIATFLIGYAKPGLCHEYKVEVSPERCIIWGPGLDPRVVVPVRYFYIQAVNQDGQNITVSPGENIQHL